MNVTSVSSDINSFRKKYEQSNIAKQSPDAKMDDLHHFCQLCLENFDSGPMLKKHMEENHLTEICRTAEMVSEIENVVGQDEMKTIENQLVKKSPTKKKASKSEKQLTVKDSNELNPIEKGNHQNVKILLYHFVICF